MPSTRLPPKPLIYRYPQPSDEERSRMVSQWIVGPALILVCLLSAMAGVVLYDAGNTVEAILVIPATIALLLMLWYLTRSVEERERLFRDGVSVNWSGVKKSLAVLVVSALMIAAGSAAEGALDHSLLGLGVCGVVWGLIWFVASLRN